MIVCLAVSQALFFVVFMAHEWLLAFSANEMLEIFENQEYKRQKVTLSAECDQVLRRTFSFRKL